MARDPQNHSPKHVSCEICFEHCTPHIVFRETCRVDLLQKVLRGTASPDSVLSRFYTGTTESLHHGDNTTIAALRKYHDENYCAPRMSLVMVFRGNHSSNTACLTQVFFNQW